MSWCLALLVVCGSISLLSPKVDGKCSGGQHGCPDTYTCCEPSNGTYGCCPMKDAICCSDDVHCCPHGYTCDVAEGICRKDVKTLSLLKKIPATATTNDVGLSNNVICAGGATQCPPDHSCCYLPDSEQVHCCPRGYTCGNGQCSSEKGKIAAIQLEQPRSLDSIVKCDHKTACLDRYTCCKADVGFVCCPKPQATCCSDQKHCCPRGFVCSTDSKTCLAGSTSLPAIQLRSTVMHKPWKQRLRYLVQLVHDSIISKSSIQGYPDGSSKCPPYSRSCRLSSGAYGCCPFSKQGVSKSVRSIICPDGQSQCPDGNTCCKLTSGQYGCCPFPNAVCCCDHKHCCPDGYTCDVSAGLCNKGNIQIAMFKKVLAMKTAVKTVNTVVCPGGQYQCPDGNTCCQLTSGQYGCCPLPNAVCCSDHIHCCPDGYTCDVSAGSCSKGNIQIAMFKKVLAMKTAVKTVNTVVCPGGQYQCPDGNTCCQLTSGQYGCCPLPNAVCCSDHIHCCPDGYTCDVSAGSCSKGNIQIAMFNKVLAMKTAVKTVNTVVCPGGQYQCPDGNTCCKLDSGQYGCCPFPNAVCCSDHKHCCPDGYTCDVSAGSCSKGNIQIAMFNTVLAMKTAVKTVNTVVCPGGQSHCPDGYTCCQLASGQYGCCPFPNAVCCSDRQHCCPQGYICHVCNNTCTKGKKKIPLFEKMLSTKVVDTKFVLNDICPDGRSQCPYGNTCCKLSSGQYGCCPLPKAVCCSDEEHCCPQGFKCNISNAACISNEQVSLSALSSAKRLKSVYCNDGFTECPNNYTCCKSPSGVYDCCALPDAVCCDDGEHCCPQGYMCDVEQGKCNKEEKPIQMIANIPSDRNQGADWMYVYCPDGSQCLDYETCCKLSDGSYGCCPVLRAVCCSDLKHCCPCGWRCDVETETCQSGSVSFQWLEKKNAFGRPRPQQMNSDEKLHFVPGNPQPVRALPTNQQRECPLYQTGCPQPSGGLHCCPLPDASCCADGEHCCPQGFSCDPKSGKCASVKKTVFSP